MENNKIIQNRRFARLEQLRKEGYFDEAQIKIRHPYLYYLYVGKYKNLSQEDSSISDMTGTYSQFLETKLMDIEYEELLRAELIRNNYEQSQEESSYRNNRLGAMQEEKQGQQEESSDQMIDSNKQTDSMSDEWQQNIRKNEEQTDLEELEISEQNLIDIVEQLFLAGKDPKTRYQLIDNNPELDDTKQIDRDEQQRYFSSGTAEEEEGQVNTDTGILDY